MRTVTQWWIAPFFLLTGLGVPLSAQQAPPAQGNESQLIAVLESDAELFDKAKACQQLAVIGTREAVPTLARLLGDEQLAHYARYALEPIPDPAVDAALRDALDRLDGKLLVGVINSIGMRRDAQAIDALKGLVGHSDPAVADAAAGALGRIATADAVQFLQQSLDGPESLRTSIGKACLTAAQMLAREEKRGQAIELLDVVRQADLPKYLYVAALEGAIRARGSDGLPLLVEQLRAEDKGLFRVALGVAHQLPGTNVTQALVDEMGKLSPVRQVLVISVLGERGDKAASGAVTEAAQRGPAEVRMAAVRALAGLGDPASVPLLLQIVGGDDPNLAQAARNSLAAMPGQEVDAALMDRLKQSAGAARLAIIDLAGRRSMTSAVPALLEAAEDEDREVQVAAIAALGRSIDLERLPELIRRLIQPTKPGVADETKAALSKACMRMPDRDACAELLLERMADVPVEAKSDLLDLLGVVGGAKALQGVAAAARQGSDPVQDAATRVLGQWMSPEVAPVLLELAKAEDGKYKIRALRGYIRIVRQFGSLPEDERLAMCRTAFELAERDDEKRLVLDAATRVPSLAGLQFVSAYLDDAGLRQAASEATVSIAEKLVNSQPAAVAKAVKKAAAVTQDNDVTARAETVLRRADRRLRRN
jgi:HEAT repeat protein